MWGGDGRPTQSFVRGAWILRLRLSAPVQNCLLWMPDDARQRQGSPAQVCRNRAVPAPTMSPKACVNDEASRNGVREMPIVGVDTLTNN